MNNSKGQVFIIAAASGTGKTSLVSHLLQSMVNTTLSISYTTREQRIGEREGEHYHFIHDDEFEQMIAGGEFLEYAKVFDYYYGTSRAQLERQLAAGKDVILEIDWQGAAQVRAKLADVVGIFIIPPSLAVLAERLEKRNQDHPEVIAKRLAEANVEIAHHHEFDYLVINDDFDQALSSLKAIVTAERLRTARQAKSHAKLLEELTKKS